MVKRLRMRATLFKRMAQRVFHLGASFVTCNYASVCACTAKHMVVTLCVCVCVCVCVYLF